MVKHAKIKEITTAVTQIGSAAHFKSILNLSSALWLVLVFV